MWKDTPRYVDGRTLRRRFNEIRVWERAQAGELHARVFKGRHPSRTLANEPFCTRSQIIGYYERNGQPVAIVHPYLRVDVTLGASGRPDPKKLYDGGVLLAARD